MERFRAGQVRGCRWGEAVGEGQQVRGCTALLKGSIPHAKPGRGLRGLKAALVEEGGGAREPLLTLAQHHRPLHKRKYQIPRLPTPRENQRDSPVKLGCGAYSAQACPLLLPISYPPDTEKLFVVPRIQPSLEGDRKAEVPAGQGG